VKPEILDTSLLAAPSGPLIVPPDAAGAVFLSLVVPTFNESENIAAFLSAVRETLDAAATEYEVIVVDDDSPDLTWEIASRLLPDFRQLRVVRRRGEQGLSSAVIRGWQLARGVVLGTINADFQHPPAVLAPMLRQIEQADLVVASRFAAGGGLGDWAMHRRINSRAAHRLGKILLAETFARTSDPLSGCYIFRREAVAGIELHPRGFKTLMEILVRGRIRTIAESSYEMRARQRGNSKLKVRHWFDYLLHLFRLRRAIGAEAASKASSAR
jgi:dolichol-phosphate mannosyltransferase